MSLIPEVIVLVLIAGVGAAPFAVVEWVQRRRFKRTHTDNENLTHILRAEGRRGYEA